MKTDKPSNDRRPSPEEYRAARIRAQRQATRAVRQTLLVVALLAGIYYCVLLAVSKKAVPEPVENGSGVSINVLTDAQAPISSEKDGEDGQNNQPKEDER